MQVEGLCVPSRTLDRHGPTAERKYSFAKESTDSLAKEVYEEHFIDFVNVLTERLPQDIALVKSCIRHWSEKMIESPDWNWRSLTQL